MIGRPLLDPRTGLPGVGALRLLFPLGAILLRKSKWCRVLLFPKQSTSHNGRATNGRGQENEMPAPSTEPRIQPLAPPYDPELARTLERMMPPGVEPLKLFRTVAHNPNVLDRFRTIGAYLLNFGTLDPLEREIVIDRTCARCGCEYEWGVHAAVFAASVGLDERQLVATVRGGPDDPAWTPRQALLVRLADELHDSATVSDGLWEELQTGWSAEQIIELLALAGFYHLVSFTANAARVEREPAASRLPR
jgi:alkylhydroperoxidase family enzyme